MTNSINYEEIDFALRNLIGELNNTKLTTKYCCSRYSRQTKLYIMFNKDIDSEVLFKWNKILKQFNTSYNGKLSLNYSSVCNNTRFTGHWKLCFEDNTVERKHFTNTVWRIADYIQPKKRVDSHELQETY